VITKEPSQHVTPLSDEQAGFPELVVPDHLTPPPGPATAGRDLPAWLELIIAVVFWGLSVAMLAFVPVFVALPYLIYEWVHVGPPAPDQLLADKTFIFLSILGVLPAHLLTLGLAWVFITEGGKRSLLKTLAFRWPKNVSPWATTLLCFLLALGLLVLGWGVTTLLGGNKTQLDLLVESSTAARIATALIATLTAPFVEELIYRGVLYSALERAAGRAISVLFVSLLFAGVHVIQYSNNIGVIVVITILSFTLTLARAYSGSLLPPFIIHLVFNGIQSIFILLTPFIPKTPEATPTTPGFELAGRLFQTISIYVWRMT
jgi:membrane protease YdiL (CAAX protease family)